MRKYLLLAVVVFFAWQSWSQRPIEYAHGVLVPGAPKQVNLRRVESFQHEEFVISRRASFNIRARVLGKERYRLGTEAELSPVDLALGWGPMSNEQVLGQLDISQVNRWYYFRYEQSPPIPQHEIIRHSSNMHMIPADRYTAKQLTRIRPGSVISIQGYLVDVDRNDGWQWRTSLRRDDTGAGACEIVWVEQLLVEDPAPLMQDMTG